MRLRGRADAVLVGRRTVLADDPALTGRGEGRPTNLRLQRIVLDAQARTPLQARILRDAHPEWTTIIASEKADQQRVAHLAKRAQVLIAPAQDGRIDLPWLLKHLGHGAVTSLLVEGGGEVHASFLLGGLAHRIAFFYAPKIIGGRSAPGAVAGTGVLSLAEAIYVREVRWRRLGEDLLLTARVDAPQAAMG